jgi:hypothetical protein
MTTNPGMPAWNRHHPARDSVPIHRAEDMGIEAIWELSLKERKETKAPRKERAVLGRFWKVVLRSGYRMGQEKVLPRIVARELQREFNPSILLSVGVKARGLRVLANHVCEAGCPGNVDECLTALMVEALVTERAGQTFHAINCSPGPKRTCDVVLVPWSSRGERPQKDELDQPFLATEGVAP